MSDGRIIAYMVLGLVNPRLAIPAEDPVGAPRWVSDKILRIMLDETDGRTIAERLIDP